MAVTALYGKNYMAMLNGRYWLLLTPHQLEERDIQGWRAGASSCAEWLGKCAAVNAGGSLSHLFQKIPDDLVEGLHGCVALTHFLHPIVTV